MSVLTPILRPVLEPVLVGIGDDVRMSAPSLESRVRAALFGAGEQGVMLNVRKPATLFQDASGTEPVTELEQPIGLLLDISGNECNASQVTTTARPLWSARVNGYLSSDDLTSDVWTKAGVSIERVAVPDFGGVTVDRLIPSSASSSFKEVRQLTRPFKSGIPVTYTVALKADGYRYVQLMGSSNNPGTFAINFDLETGEETFFALGTSTVLDQSITPLGDGWFELSVTTIRPSTSNTSGRIGFNVVQGATSPRGATWTGDGVSGVLVLRQQLEFSYAKSRYQRVDADGGYDANGFPELARFDGVDDSMVVPLPAALGDACTIGRSIPGSGAYIETGQTVGDSLQIEDDFHAFVVVDRELSDSEAALLTQYLNEAATP